MKRLLCLVAVLLLAACRSSNVPLPTSGSSSGYPTASDTWEAYVVENEAIIHRKIELAPEITDLINGSQEVNPKALEEILIATGASKAECQSRIQFTMSNLECEYNFPVVGSGDDLSLVPLPDEFLLSFLAEIPQQAASGIRIQENGKLFVPGVLSELPSSPTKKYPDGSYSSRSFTLTSPSRLGIRGETRLPPGSEAQALIQLPATVGFFQEYMARPSAWLAFGTALLSVLIALAIIYPVSARLPIQPRAWKPNLTRLPFFLRWFARLIVRFINWLRENWPRLLNTSTASLIILLGIQNLITAWELASIYDQAEQVQSLYKNLVALFPWFDGFEILLWPGWPIVLALFSLCSILVGVGLLSRQEIARYLVIGMGLAVIGGLIYLWPQLLIMPPYIPFQTTIVLWLGEMILLATALLARGFTHPQFRRYYYRSGENQ